MPRRQAARGSTPLLSAVRLVGVKVAEVDAVGLRKKERAFVVRVDVPLLAGELEQIRQIAVARELTVAELLRAAAMVAVGLRPAPKKSTSRKAIREGLEGVIAGRFRCGGCRRLERSNERLRAQLVQTTRQAAGLEMALLKGARGDG